MKRPPFEGLDAIKRRADRAADRTVLLLFLAIAVVMTVLMVVVELLQGGE